MRLMVAAAAQPLKARHGPLTRWPESSRRSSRPLYATVQRIFARKDHRETVGAPEDVDGVFSQVLPSRRKLPIAPATTGAVKSCTQTTGTAQ
jgi:hypothetical protein